MTHLGVSVDCFTNLVTMQLNNDNKAQAFYFDRQAIAPFSIPAGYCFVITDVFVNPEVTSYSASQFYLVVVTADGGRSVTVRCGGHTAHLRLKGGLVVPGTKGLDVRNTTFSSGPVEVQLLGYFEKEPLGPQVGKPFTG